MASGFLTSRPRGAYTCARGNADGYVLSKDLHVRRLLDSTQVIFGAVEDLDLKQRLVNLFETERLPADMMIVVLLYRDLLNGFVIEHQMFPVSMKRSFVRRVAVGGGAGRRNPAAKDTAWIIDRKPLEHLKKTLEAEELILVDSYQGVELLEGLVTNLFVVTKDNTVLTAPADKVLPGTMRQLAIDACQNAGLIVKEEAPRWASRKDWIAVFLTSVAKPCNFVKSLVPSDESIGGDSVVLDVSESVVTIISAAADALVLKN